MEITSKAHNNDTTSYSVGVSIGIKEVATVNFSVSYTEDHFKYIHQDGRHHSSDLSQ